MKRLDSPAEPGNDGLETETPTRLRSFDRLFYKLMVLSNVEGLRATARQA
jgi:hypothetical protein